MGVFWVVLGFIWIGFGVRFQVLLLLNKEKNFGRPRKEVALISPLLILIGILGLAEGLKMLGLG
jgi:hypothetical protein